MARAGDEFFDPIRGQRLIFRQTARDSKSELVEVEAHYRSYSEAPPEHLHPEQEEYFEILAGSIDTKINGQERRYEAGESFRIPAGIVHQMWNGDSTEARLLWQTRPALHTEDFFAIMWGLAQAGKTNKAGLPNLLQLAVILQQYRREFRPLKPPSFVQNIVFAFLAPLGRLCGYRAILSK
ncbi:cupin domain-containing protein [Ktedonosporobacter rubrisoli]|uniref:Cupin domain-containing protein n=1 Tax=Ktedonosporobacter rubrisoli TaxID=2509675 RepID=A0A4P6JY28_KTERU|nr:cupin domain-containing protein [Ktedonosporobacter rubrisoli]QBD80362.1 cupin domain-containing protein [Ktedonosporobacter rubrisoli]